MRLKITFDATRPNTCVPLFYSAALGRTLEKWFRDLLTEPTSEFVFSRLFIKSRIVDTRASTIRLLSPTANLYVSMFQEPPPTLDLQQTLKGKPAEIGLDGGDIVVESVRILHDPAWRHHASFRMLSPTALPNGNGAWIRADEPEAREKIRSLLLQRYERVTGNSPISGADLVVELDEKYVAERGGGAGVMKIIKLVDASGMVSEVEAFICPVSFSGDPKLISLAYHTGVGALGRQGFGMVG
jgi:CRISPR-associated endoribonuclease Cas6